MSDEYEGCDISAILFLGKIHEQAVKYNLLEVEFDSLIGALNEKNGIQASTRMTAIYIAKYNRFVDNILGRMNKILRKSYDPVSVRLQPVDVKKKSTKTKTGTKKQNKSRRRRGHQKRRQANKRSFDDTTFVPEVVTEIINISEVMDAQEIVSSTASAPFIRISTIPQSKPVAQDASETTAQILASSIIQSSPSPVAKESQSTTSKSASTSKTIESTASFEDVAKSTTQDIRISSPALPTTASSNRASGNGKKNKKKLKGKQNKKSKPRAKGTLYGLSSLRRSGDVTVNIMANHTTVKTDFTMGPMILKVEKETGRGAKKELKSATATTTEMLGKLTLRIPNGGGATLHSIKVLQPKQVRVDSIDNHDRTREFIWKRSSDIAHVVSDKLVSVTKSMLKTCC